MGLTSIPTRTDGSIGREKLDATPAVDLARSLPAGEYNRLADALIAVSTAVGLGNGSTPGSIEMRLAALERANPIAYVASFITYDGGYSYQIAPDAPYYWRPGEDPESLEYANGVGGSGYVLQIDYQGPMPPQYQVFVMPQGQDPVVAFQVMERNDAYVLLRCSSPLGSVERVDLMICYPSVA